MLKNYIDISYLQQLFPEVESYKWKDRTYDYSNVKDSAEQEVRNYFISMGKDVIKLRPETSVLAKTTITSAGLTTDAVENLYAKFRVVVILSANNLQAEVEDPPTPAEVATVKIEGSMTGEANTFEEVKSFSFTSASLLTFYTDEVDGYSYYRAIITTPSDIELTIYLVETVYDVLYRYKWLEFIFRNLRKSKEDRFDILVDEMIAGFNEVISSGKFLYDANSDGVYSDTEIINTKHLIISR